MSWCKRSFFNRARHIIGMTTLVLAAVTVMQSSFRAAKSGPFGSGQYSLFLCVC
jgi:hypothetical protein